MYTLLDAVSDAERRAESAAFADRLRYGKFIEAAEQFASKNGLIAGGATANRLLLGDPTESGIPAPVSFESFRYEFYSAHAVQHARSLTDTLFAVDPSLLGRYATMRTKVPDASLAIEVDGRDMFLITALKVRRGVRMADVMIPSSRAAQFAQDADGAALALQCSGPEIQLIEVYTALCNPAKAGAWGGLLTVEAGLRKIFDAEIRAKLAEAVEPPARKIRGGAAGSQAEKLMRALRAQFATGAGRVVVGAAAAALIAGTHHRLGAANHLQVVSVGPLEADAEEIVTIANKAGCDVQWTIGDPNIPIDPRLKRMSVHLLSPNAAMRRELVLEVYNAAAHELIPYTIVGELAATVGGAELASKHYRTETLAWHPSELPPGLKIGTPFAVMRFRLADMWTIQMLLKMEIIDAGYAKGALNGILADYNITASAYDRLLENKDTDTIAARCLPMSDYVGRFEDPEIAQKRAAQSANNVKFHPPYMPLLNKSTGRSNDGSLKSSKLLTKNYAEDDEDPAVDVYADE
jgi:hypothetical protein